MAKREIHKTIPCNARAPRQDSAGVMVDDRSDAHVLLHAAAAGGKSVLLRLTPCQAESLAKALIVGADAVRENSRG